MTPRVYSRRDPEERFWSHVAVREADECWLWTAAVHPQGYGSFGPESGQHVFAHRMAYEYVNGPIPKGLQVDHTCHNRAYEAGECRGGKTCPHRRCVNPSHLEAVDGHTNRERGAGGPKKFCKRGHSLTDPANVRLDYDKRWDSYRKVCRACRRIIQREYARRLKGEGLSLEK